MKKLMILALMMVMTIAADAMPYKTARNASVPLPVVPWVVWVAVLWVAPVAWDPDN